MVEGTESIKTDCTIRIILQLGMIKSEIDMVIDGELVRTALQQRYLVRRRR